MVLEKNNKETMMRVNIVPKEDSRHPASEIVHEIRNPLAAVKGFLQLIKPYLKESGREQYADVAITELNRAVQLITEYLHGVKPHSDTIENITINKVIRELALFYENEASLKNIELTTTLSNLDASIKIPVNRLKQILLNIINNAIEAIDECKPSSRKIEITTDIEHEKATITIADYCGSMSDEILHNLFTPYFSSKKNGTGIGLSISQKIVEEYGGTIHVESIPGMQTTFTISVPADSIQENKFSI